MTSPQTAYRDPESGRARVRPSVSRFGLTPATALVAALLVGSACDGTPPGGDLAGAGSDADLDRLAAEVIPSLEERSGLTVREPVRIARRSREELLTYLTAKLDEEFPPDEAAATVRVYSLLGLVQPDLDLRALLLDLYTEQVAGFYEPDSTALFVLDDQPPEALEGLLVHELVHAIQDQSVGLSALAADSLPNDRAAAAHAAVEGHATLVMLEFMMEQMTGSPVDLAEAPEIGDQLLPAIEGMTSQFPALGSAPPIVQRSLLFPYMHGAAFVQRLWAREGRVAPFGRYLPTSTEQVFDGDLADRPIGVLLDVAGGVVLHENQLGRLELEVLLESLLGRDGARHARGWGGDTYVLVQSDDAAESGLLWVALWDSTDGRDRLLDALRPELGKLGEPASLVPIEIDDHAGLLLRVGPVSDVTVVVSTPPVTVR